MVDPMGLRCADDEEAMEKARFLARQMASDPAMPAIRIIIVINDECVEIGRVNVEAQPAR